MEGMKMRKFKEARALCLLVVFVLVVGLLAACPGVQSVKPYELGKVAAETILFDARVAQNKGIITEQQFIEVRRVYDQLKIAQDIAINTRMAYIAGTIGPDGKPTTTEFMVQSAMNSVLSISMQLVNLAQKLGLMK
jgi:hypothetical protein